MLFLIKATERGVYQIDVFYINPPFQFSVAFHIEIIHLICSDWFFYEMKHTAKIVQ